MGRVGQQYRYVIIMARGTLWLEETIAVGIKKLSNNTLIRARIDNRGTLWLEYRIRNNYGYSRLKKYAFDRTNIRGTL